MLETPEVLHEESKDFNIFYPSIAIPMGTAHLAFVSEAKSMA
jgi:hypothetical protein